MTKRQYILFAIPALIWGSTWYVIKFQLGMVDPLLSVAYRFMLAGIALAVFCFATGKRMRFTAVEHALMLTLGLSLFGINYWLVYEAETKLTSGVVAVIFSLIIVFNILLNALFLKGKIKRDVIFAAILGIIGTVFLFKNELSQYKLKRKRCVGFSDLFRRNFHGISRKYYFSLSAKKENTGFTGKCIRNDVRRNRHVYYRFGFK